MIYFGCCHVWRRQWHPTPELLPGKSRGLRSLVGCSPWGRMTERLHFYFSLSCIEEGNGNPLQCSCLESPRDGGAWWAAVYGVTQSRTRLKRLSSSSSNPSGFEMKRPVFIPIPKKGNAKECSNYCTTALISHPSKVMLKIFQASLQ